jgi:hypothetical protein
LFDFPRLGHCHNPSWLRYAAFVISDPQVLDLAHGASVYFDSVHVRHSVTETWWSRMPAANEVFPSPCLLSAFIKANLLTHCGWNPYLAESPCTRHSYLGELDERPAKKRKVSTVSRSYG